MLLSPLPGNLDSAWSGYALGSIGENWVQANTLLNLTLHLHELATNAVKYGAVSNGTGQVQVSWDTAGVAHQRRLHLTWQEAGGPPVKEPRHRGFGSLLIQSWRCRHPDRVSPGRPKVSSRASI